MVLICPKCEARLQLDEAKAPSQPFKVRCPKCQTSVSVQLSETPSELDRASFERPPAAPLFKANAENAKRPWILQKESWAAIGAAILVLIPAYQQWRTAAAQIGEARTAQSNALTQLSAALTEKTNAQNAVEVALRDKAR